MSAGIGAGERIEVQIESLEFEGLAVREPARVQRAFITELTRLLEAQGLPPHLRTQGAEVELDAGALADADLHDPDRLGRAVARQIYGGLTR